MHIYIYIGSAMCSEIWTEEKGARKTGHCTKIVEEHNKKLNTNRNKIAARDMKILERKRMLWNKARECRNYSYILTNMPHLWHLKYAQQKPAVKSLYNWNRGRISTIFLFLDFNAQPNIIFFRMSLYACSRVYIVQNRLLNMAKGKKWEHYHHHHHHIIKNHTEKKRERYLNNSLVVKKMSRVHKITTSWILFFFRSPPFLQCKFTTPCQEYLFGKFNQCN